MIPALAWKEYRELRGLWLAIAALAWLLALNAALFARGGLAGLAADAFTRQTIIVLLYSLMVAQGVVSGVQLLAGERDAGTLAFLDALSGQRSAVWTTKFVTGCVLTVSQALMLYGILLFLGLGAWNYFPSLATAGLLGLVWGLVGGAVCERVFPGILTGVALAAGNFALLLPSGGGMALVSYFFLVISSGLVVGALAVSVRKFCDVDRDRLWRLHKVYGQRRPRDPFGWQALLWLAEKQGRWIVWPGLVLSAIAGIFMHLGFDFFWPAFTWIVGLVCGTAVFMPEQPGQEQRFLGAQRYPPGRIWFVKTLFWLTAAVLMATFAFLTMSLERILSEGPESGPLFRAALFRGMERGQNLNLFLAMWLCYGFCFGQFCSLLSRRVIVSAVLGAGTSFLVLVLWLPSLAFESLRAWQILAVPFLLLVAVRLSMWTWFCDRLYTRRHLLGLAAVPVLAAAWIGAVLWDRAVEIPDVGEPFDVAAFDAKLDQAAKSGAGALIRHASGTLQQHRTTMEQVAKVPPVYLARGDLLAACRQVLYHDEWPAQEKAIGLWLDKMFAGEWLKDLRRAAAMPLGLVVDARQCDWNWYEGEKPESQNRHFYPDMGVLLSVRALQLEARGDYAEALTSLDTQLALSRQLLNCSPGLGWREWNGTGYELERQALIDLDRWLDKVGPRPELLRGALTLLQRHEKETPDPLDNLKADYYVKRNNPAFFFDCGGDPAHPVLPGKAVRLLRQNLAEAPWEKERQTRFLRAYYQAQLRLAKLPPGSWNMYAAPWSVLVLADQTLPASHWKRIVTALEPEWWTLWPSEFPPCLRQVRARQIYIALLLYQIDQGHAAAKLEDLVPVYLTAVPVDPFASVPVFNYKVVGEDEAKNADAYDVRRGYITRKEHVVAGQGLLWLDALSRPPLWLMYWFGGDSSYFPVPLWKK